MGILVTGGGSGIGLAVSRRLLADGAAVTIVGRNAQRLQDARQILIDAGADPASIRAHAADMSREDAGRQAGRRGGQRSSRRAARRRRVRGGAQGPDGPGNAA
jgi:NAD(P)-dependent dehydrogenase (short-subunit alcohol dehydrogenase family)